MRITISEPDLHLAYNLENWNCTDRNHFNAFANDQDLVETYLPPFELTFVMLKFLVLSAL